MADKTPIVTRFAPSPTGYLHIGGARTALFNWLYAKVQFTALSVPLFRQSNWNVVPSFLSTIVPTIMFQKYRSLSVYSTGSTARCNTQSIVPLVSSLTTNMSQGCDSTIIRQDIKFHRWSCECNHGSIRSHAISHKVDLPLNVTSVTVTAAGANTPTISF